MYTLTDIYFMSCMIKGVVPNYPHRLHRSPNNSLKNFS